MESALEVAVIEKNAVEEFIHEFGGRIFVEVEDVDGFAFALHIPGFDMSAAATWEQKYTDVGLLHCFEVGIVGFHCNWVLEGLEVVLFRPRLPIWADQTPRPKRGTFGRVTEIVNVEAVATQTGYNGGLKFIAPT